MSEIGLLNGRVSDVVVYTDIVFAQISQQNKLGNFITRFNWNLIVYY